MEMKIFELSENGDICSWLYSDLYSESEKRLRELLQSGKDFQTSWGGNKHELNSVRFIASGDRVVIEGNAFMDELPDLVYDALEDVCPLSDIVYDDIKMEELIHDVTCLLYDSEFSTEVYGNTSLPRNARYDEIVKEADKLIAELNEELDENYEMCKEAVLQYV